MKRYDRLRNIQETLKSLDGEIKKICVNLESNLKNLAIYNDKLQKVMIEIEDEKKREIYGRSSDYDFESLRVSLEQDAGNVVYEAINIMGSEEFIKRRQNVIYAFWFLGQFDVYALELANRD